ncbi:DUF3105 domain-containing protein [Micromonospora halophytica]|uniref:DUF3105 domain-containing protein n=1 Tax=Micromonospora halophytica TaxID=47864 RepID=A0A1C5HXB2_9ACTN|nr:DUF3105 domain-containing protein [Micromonospora halophytica]SCG50533.1 Protein of unknown function [Micromonospora halophytica]
MKRRWLGTVVSAVVTVLSVATMSSLGVGVLLGLTDDTAALSCDRVPGTPQPFEGERHIPYEGAPHEPYRTMPPTSGPHSPRVVVPGIYRDPVPAELQVHVLEHGHVLVQYAPDVPAADVDALERLGRRHPRDVVVAPYPALGQGIGLTGWQRLHRLDRLDERAVEEFVTKVAGRYDHGWQDGATDCVSS